MRSFFAKETGGRTIEEVLADGKDRLDFLFAKYFYTMEVNVRNKAKEEVVRRPMLGYALKIKSALKYSMVELLKVTNNFFLIPLPIIMTTLHYYRHYPLQVDITDPLIFPQSAQSACSSPDCFRSTEDRSDGRDG